MTPKTTQWIKKGVKKKTVKAWAVLNTKKTSASKVYLNRSHAIGEARGMCLCGCLEREVVPCTITYQIPAKKKKKS